MIKVMGFETDRYSGGYRVYDDAKGGFYDGKIADFEGETEDSRNAAQELADKLNTAATPQMSCRGFGRTGSFGWWKV